MSRLAIRLVMREYVHIFRGFLVTLIFCTPIQAIAGSSNFNDTTDPCLSHENSKCKLCSQLTEAPISTSSLPGNVSPEMAKKVLSSQNSFLILTTPFEDNFGHGLIKNDPRLFASDSDVGYPESALGFLGNTTSSVGLFAHIQGNHVGSKRAIVGVFGKTAGSSGLGTPNADVALELSMTRDAYGSAGGFGEQDVIYLKNELRGILPHSASEKSSGMDLNATELCYADIGFCGFGEEVTTTLDRYSGLVKNNLDRQIDVFDDYDGNSFGDYENLQQGELKAALMVTDQVAPAWAPNSEYSLGTIVSSRGSAYQVIKIAKRLALSTIDPGSEVLPMEGDTVRLQDGYWWLQIHQGRYKSRVDDVLVNMRQGRESIRLEADGVVHFMGGSSTADGVRNTATGSPEGVLSSTVGGFTCREDGGSDDTCYIKVRNVNSAGEIETAASPFGWAPVQTSSVAEAVTPLGSDFKSAAIISARVNIVIGSGASIGGLRLSQRQNEQIIINESNEQAARIYPVTADGRINDLSPGSWIDIVPNEVLTCFFTGKNQHDCVSSSIGQNIIEKSGNYQINMSDCGHVIRDTAKITHVYRVSSRLPVGCNVDVVQAGEGAISFEAAAGFSIEQFQPNGMPLHITAGRYGNAHLFVDSQNSFLLSGDVR